MPAGNMIEGAHGQPCGDRAERLLPAGPLRPVQMRRASPAGMTRAVLQAGESTLKPQVPEQAALPAVASSHGFRGVIAV